LGKKDFKRITVGLDERHWNIAKQIMEATECSAAEALRTALRVLESLAARYGLTVKFFFSPTEVVERFKEDWIRRVREEIRKK